MNEPKAIERVPIPKKMLLCTRDSRGYPIPYLMIPGSQIHIDMHKQEQCVRRRLCMICGKKLDNKKWFIGGIMAAQNRLFTDPAMHRECAVYALQVCPFLSNPDMKYRKKYDNDTILFVETVPGTSIKRSPSQLLMQTGGFRAVGWRGHVYVLANPWKYLEHWREGKRIPDLEGQSLQDMTGGVFDPGGRFHNELEEIS